MKKCICLTRGVLQWVGWVYGGVGGVGGEEVCVWGGGGRGGLLSLGRYETRTSLSLCPSLSP